MADKPSPSPWSILAKANKKAKKKGKKGTKQPKGGGS
jgi:hypothetical protein